ncbi:MAG: T9SS C-terminal target domain-containing protein [Chitinophagaceae bacterium]|nr:MAG: T9SS C-terminal target domain-containing protein [Chitinophagaceae bacterium]
MKKSIYLFLSLLFSYNAFAQISISKENFPKIGDTITLANDTTQISIGSAGANQIWDFSMLENHGEYSSYFIDPANTPFANSFPNSNIAVISSEDSEEFYVFIDISEDGIYLLGFADNSETPPFVVEFETPRQIYEFPFTYEDNFSQSYSELIFQDTTSLIGADSVRFYQKTERVVYIDGYGTVYLPNDTLEALRVREVEYNVDSTQVLFGGSWTNLEVLRDTFISYQWYSDLTISGWALVTINLDNYNDVSGTAEWYENIPNQISSVPNRIKNDNLISIYPNPASEYISVKFEKNTDSNYRLNLYDLKGQLIKTQNINQQNNRIELNGISKGMYIYSIQKNGNIPQHFGKLNIQ